MTLVGIGIRVAQTAFKYRKYIYRTLVAQDRAIDKAYRFGGYGRQVRYGVRHGLVAGTIAGTVLSEMGSIPDSGIPEKRQTRYNKVSKTYQRYQFDSRRRREYCRGYNNRRRRHVYSGRY